MTKYEIGKRTIFHSLITLLGVTSAGSLLINPVTVIPSIGVIAAANYGYKKLEDWL